jgi:putative lipoic acid-binding regulatory protein
MDFYLRLMTPATPPPSLAVMVFPMDFPIKVLGAQVAGFVEAIEAIALAFDPKFDRSTTEFRPSSTGKYLGVTITIQATSQDMLDELYRTLSTHPMVKVVL